MNNSGRFPALAMMLLLVFTLASCGSGAAESTVSRSGETASRAVSSAPAGTASAGTSETASSSETTAESSRTLVVYFSCTGTTKGIAETLADITGGTLYEITPAQPYTDADRNYNDNSSRTTIEQNDPSARPEISGAVENWKQYDTVFLGYPIWWGKAPRILDTFVESYHFEGKTVIPFCTSAASDIGSSGNDLAKLAGGTGTWLDGKRFAAGTSAEALSAWFTGLALQNTK